MPESDTADRFVEPSRLKIADFEKAMVVADVESAEEPFAVPQRATVSLVAENLRRVLPRSQLASSSLSKDNHEPYAHTLYIRCTFH